MKSGYKVRPFSINRRMAAASVSVCSRKNTIHTICEVDVSVPLYLISQHREKTGERLSITAYIVSCLAKTLTEFPSMNAMRKGQRLIVFDSITIGVLVEREIAGEKVPEPFGITNAGAKSFRQVHEGIRAAQNQKDKRLGGLSGASWVRLIPSFLFELFIRIAAKSVRMASRYGVVAVTAVGMFGRGKMWLLPISGSTISVAVGTIEEERLFLTISFDHDIIDGAPAARFTGRLTDMIAGGDYIREIVDECKNPG